MVCCEQRIKKRLWNVNGRHVNFPGPGPPSMCTGILLALFIYMLNPSIKMWRRDGNP